MYSNRIPEINPDQELEIFPPSPPEFKPEETTIHPEKPAKKEFSKKEG